MPTTVGQQVLTCKCGPDRPLARAPPDGRRLFAPWSPESGRCLRTLTRHTAPNCRAAMTEHLRAYNSLWQVRSDSWCRLEEAADRLTRPDTAGELKDKCVAACQELLTRLSSLEPYWAFPGYSAIRPRAKAFRRRQLRQVLAGGRPAESGADPGVLPLRRCRERRHRRAGHVSLRPAPARRSGRGRARPSLLRGAGRREDDRGPGTRAAQRGS